MDEDEAKELAKTYVETFAKTLRGVDLYLDFAPEQARDSWRYSDGNEVVSDVIELLRLLECEDSDAEGEENDGDEEGEEDDGDEEGEEEDGSPKVKFPAELVESSGFLSWVDNYGPHGIACPIPSDQLNYITMVGINALAEAEGATRLQRSSILRGILTAVALRDSMSKSDLRAEESELTVTENTLWEGHDDSPDAVKEVVAEVEKNVAVGFELVKGWLEEVGDGEMEKKEEPSWMMKKQKIEEVNEDGSNDEEAEPQDEDNDEAEDEDKEPDNMSGEDEDKEPENMNGEDEDKVDSDSDSDSDAEDEEQVSHMQRSTADSR